MPSRVVRICKICDEENLPWAHFCKGCNASLEDSRIAAAPVKLKLPPALMLGVLLCAMAFALLWTIGENAAGTAAGRAAHGPKTLRVLWHKFYGSFGQEWVVGEVRNESSETLHRVMAAAEYYTDDNRQVAMARALLKPADLAPGQTARFKVAVPYLEEIVKSGFHFQTTGGDQISFSRDEPAPDSAGTGHRLKTARAGKDTPAPGSSGQ